MYRSNSLAVVLVLAISGWFCLVGNLFAQDTVQSIRGRTMGTTYMVKVFGEPKLDVELTTLIDAELRNVNDQMSTYLKSSEISQFNASSSTDWISVSAQTALVVDYARQVADKNGRRFRRYGWAAGERMELWS